jgi:hypothetical protein
MVDWKFRRNPKWVAEKRIFNGEGDGRSRPRDPRNAVKAFRKTARGKKRHCNQRRAWRWSSIDARGWSL